MTDTQAKTAGPTGPRIRHTARRAVLTALALPPAALALAMGRPARAQSGPGATGAAAAPAAMSAALAALYDKAKGERELTWYVSHYNTETAEAVGRDFTRAYPGIQVNVIRATAQVVFQRLNQDLKAGMANCDVLSSTDASHFEFLKSRKLLATYRPENADALHPVYRNMDPDDQFHATATAMIVIVYRSDKYDDRTAPTSWQDLLDPRFKGQLAFGHPAYSGYVGAWAIGLTKLYGWSYFEKLKANQPQIGRSINDVKTMLDSGERSVGHDGDGPFRKKAHDGAPYKTTYPSDGAIVVLAGTGVMANAPKPNAARLFENYLISRESQQILVSRDWAPSMRADVPLSPGARAVSEVKTLRIETKDMQMLPSVRDRWRDTFGS